MSEQGMMRTFMVIALAVAALGASGARAADWVGGSCSLESTAAALQACIKQELSVGDHISKVYNVLGRPVRIITFTVSDDATAATAPKYFADGSIMPPGLYEVHRFDYPGEVGHLLVTFRSSRVVTVDHFKAGSMRR